MKYELTKGKNKTIKNKSKKSNSNTDSSNNFNSLIGKMDKFIDSLKEDRKETKKMYEEEKKERNNLVNFLLKKLTEQRIGSNQKHNDLVLLLTRLNGNIEKLVGIQPKKKNEKK